MLPVDDQLVLPERELSYRSSRSSGPGGQNVNKVETRVTLLFDIPGSAVLDETQKELVRQRLATRINKKGVLRVVSQRHRTQNANREAVRTKLAELLAEALRPRRPRRPTKTPEKARRRRLEDKKRRSELKRRRGRVRES
ncbi:MAG: aminoacyl-tRNA hydrolase [Acidobacteria bacterium]|nr:aminoacyl-tRNA hydrolase [Acidobacteriota bacterium]